MTAIQKAREALEAARDAIALHRAFEAVPADRGGHFGPKGKALSAWREAEAFAEGCVSRALAALDAETETLSRKCATEGCGKPAIYHFIRGDVGSHYCRDCYMRVQALVTPEARS